MAMGDRASERAKLPVLRAIGRVVAKRRYTAGIGADVEQQVLREDMFDDLTQQIGERRWRRPLTAVNALPRQEETCADGGTYQAEEVPRVLGGTRGCSVCDDDHDRNRHQVSRNDDVATTLRLVRRMAFFAVTKSTARNAA